MVGGAGAVVAFRSAVPLVRLLLLVGLSGGLTLLQLVSSLFALFLYDRVLPARSIEALGALMMLMLVLHVCFAGLDLWRARIISRAALAFTLDLDRRFIPSSAAGTADGAIADVVTDVRRVGQFLVGPGPAAYFDALWLPACLAVSALLHPALGLFAAGSVFLLVGMTIRVVAQSRALAEEIARLERQRVAFIAAGAAERERAQVATIYELKSEAGERSLQNAAVSKALRLALMSGGLGLGALLVIQGAISAGALVASSILFARTLTSLDAALAHLSGLVTASEAYARLHARSRPLARETVSLARS